MLQKALNRLLTPIFDNPLIKKNVESTKRADTGVIKIGDYQEKATDNGYS